MVHEKALDEIYRSIGTGVLSDNAIIALARFAKLGPEGLSEGDKRALTLARQYLASAAEGPAAIEKKPLSNSSLDRALAFDETTEAVSLHLLSIRPGLQKRFAEYLSGLLEVLDVIVEGKRPGAEDVEDLRSFFRSISRHTLSRVATRVQQDVQPEAPLEGYLW